MTQLTTADIPVDTVAEISFTSPVYIQSNRPIYFSIDPENTPNDKAGMTYLPAKTLQKVVGTTLFVYVKHADTVVYVQEERETLQHVTLKLTGVQKSLVPLRETTLIDTTDVGYIQVTENSYFSVTHPSDVVPPIDDFLPLFANRVYKIPSAIDHVWVYTPSANTALYQQKGKEVAVGRDPQTDANTTDITALQQQVSTITAKMTAYVNSVISNIKVTGGGTGSVSPTVISTLKVYIDNNDTSVISTLRALNASTSATLRKEFSAVNTLTLTTSKNYTDDTRAYLEDYVDDSIGTSETGTRLYIDTQDASTLTSANEYTQRAIAGLTLPGGTVTTHYVDDKDTSVKQTLRVEISAGDTLTLTNAKAYTNAQIAAIPPGVTEAYVNTKTSSAVATAKVYTDNELTKAVASLHTEINALSQTVTDNTNRFLAIETKNTAQDSAIATLQSGQTTQNNKISALTTKVASLTASQTTQDGKISALEASQTAQDSKIVKLQSGQATLNASQSVQDGKITSLESGLQTVNNRVSSLTTAAGVKATGSYTWPNLQQFQNAVVKKLTVANTTGNVSSKSAILDPGTIPGGQARTIDLEKVYQLTTATASGSVTSNATIKGMKTQITANTNAIASVKATISSVKATIASIKTTITAIQAKDVAQDTRLNAHSAAITALQAAGGAVSPAVISAIQTKNTQQDQEIALLQAAVADTSNKTNTAVATALFRLSVEVAQNKRTLDGIVNNGGMYAKAGVFPDPSIVKERTIDYTTLTGLPGPQEMFMIDESVYPYTPKDFLTEWGYTPIATDAEVQRRIQVMVAKIKQYVPTNVYTESVLDNHPVSAGPGQWHVIMNWAITKWRGSQVHKLLEYAETIGLSTPNTFDYSSVQNYADIFFESDILIFLYFIYRQFSDFKLETAFAHSSLSTLHLSIPADTVDAENCASVDNFLKNGIRFLMDASDAHLFKSTPHNSSELIMGGHVLTRDFVPSLNALRKLLDGIPQNSLTHDDVANILYWPLPVFGVPLDTSYGNVITAGSAQFKYFIVTADFVPKPTFDVDGKPGYRYLKPLTGVCKSSTYCLIKNGPTATLPTERYADHFLGNDFLTSWRYSYTMANLLNKNITMYDIEFMKTQLGITHWQVLTILYKYLYANPTKNVIDFMNEELFGTGKLATSAATSPYVGEYTTSDKTPSSFKASFDKRTESYLQVLRPSHPDLVGPVTLSGDLW